MALLLSCGEPAGIGPELCLRAAAKPWPCALVAVGDEQVLRARAAHLGLDIKLHAQAHADPAPQVHRPGHLPYVHVPVRCPVEPGQLNRENAAHVLEVLRYTVGACMSGRYAGIVTAPVHKGVINEAGVPFTGHTEFLAAGAGVPTTVMILASAHLRVALATTHLPLREVPDAITEQRLHEVLNILHSDLKTRFGIARPRILVCGLNPHAGEDGHLGQEEIQVIQPALAQLREQGMQLIGPLPADTAFTRERLQGVDAVLAMYHDQGLPVLKHSGFGEAVNVTLGLPFVRTSVDHGTALDLALTGTAHPGSMFAAIEMAAQMTGVPQPCSGPAPHANT